MVNRVFPNGVGDVAGQAEKAVVENHDALDSGAGDDPHQEVRHDGGHQHHQAFYHHHGGEEEEGEVGEVIGAFLEADEVVG